MVSQSSSVGYTFMGKLLTWQLSKRQPLACCTRGEGHKRSLLLVNRDYRILETIVKQNSLKSVREHHKEWTAARVRASRTTTHRCMQHLGLIYDIPCMAAVTMPSIDHASLPLGQADIPLAELLLHMTCNLGVWGLKPVLTLWAVLATARGERCGSFQSQWCFGVPYHLLVCGSMQPSSRTF